MNGYVFWGAAAMGQLAGLLGLVSEAMVPASRRMGASCPSTDRESLPIFNAIGSRLKRPAITAVEAGGTRVLAG